MRAGRRDRRRAVDLRVVAATHRDLDAMVADGQLPRGPLARLAGFELALPPLAERRVDLGLVLGEIVPAEARSPPRPCARCSRTPGRATSASWPASSSARSRSPEAGELAPHAPARRDRARARPARRRAPGGDDRRAELVALLEKHHGNVSKIAVELGRVRQQVQRWLKRYGLDPARYRE